MRRGRWVAVVAVVMAALALSEARPQGDASAAVLRDGAPSAEALIDRFLEALKASDGDALRRLRLTEAEYREIVLPGHVGVGEPPKTYREDVSEFAWDLLNTKSHYSEAVLLGEFGGRQYTVTGVEYEEGTQEYATYKAYKQLRLQLREGDGSEVELRTGSIAEIGGRFKFVSFIRD